MLYAHLHGGESIEQPRFGSNGPPVVQENLQGSPHRNPAADQQAFLEDLAPTAVAQRVRDKIAPSDRGGKKRKSDDEARSAYAEQLSQPPSRGLAPVGEECADGVLKHRSFVRKAGAPVEVHDEGKPRISRLLPAPADDELLCRGIQIPLEEGRRIDRVEELLQLRNPYFDGPRVLVRHMTVHVEDQR